MAAEAMAVGACTPAAAVVADFTAVAVAEAACALPRPVAAAFVAEWAVAPFGLERRAAAFAVALSAEVSAAVRSDSVTPEFTLLVSTVIASTGADFTAAASIPIMATIVASSG
jgi:hypothetical protein